MVEGLEPAVTFCGYWRLAALAALAAGEADLEKNEPIVFGAATNQRL